ncbi:MAG TPA: PQQ-dependent catabolism-associated beta-propeller protein [Methylomirabilota bacterium]|nr:PQQ-dependent catabolism-associated beta-propeller protein [Methylomirabilota bacterium]
MRQTFLVVALGGAALIGAAGVTRPAAAETIYVTNEKGNTVSVIDGDKLEVIKTIPVGERPRGFVMSKDYKTLYICASDSDEIEAIDLDTDNVTSLVSTPDPERIDISPDGKFLFASNENDNLVSVIDIGAQRVVDQIPVGVEPEGMAVSPDGKFVVNTSETTNMAHVIDIAQKKIIANVLVDPRPRVAMWKKDASQVWVSSEIGGTVSVIDASNFSVLKKISFAVQGLNQEAIQGEGIAFTPDEKTAFVALGPANRVAVVDTQTYEVKDYILVGQRVWNITMDSSGARLYSANGLSNDVTVIDVASMQPIKSIPVGEEPWGAAVRP